MIDILIGIGLAGLVAFPILILYSCLKVGSDADDEMEREYIKGESNERQ